MKKWKFSKKKHPDDMVHIGGQNNYKYEQKFVISVELFLAHREEILAMKEQVEFIQRMLAA